jgi:chlorophyll synthase
MGAPLENPRDRAPWYNATGAKRYVLGMLASAFAVHPFLAIVS